MKILKKVARLLFHIVILKKIVAYSLLVFLLYIFQDFLLIFFLTFIFGYLFLTFGTFLESKLHYYLPKIFSNKKYILFIKKIFPVNVIVLILYILFGSFLIYTIIDLPPKLTNELSVIPKQIPMLAEPIGMVNSKLEEIKNINTELGKDLSVIFSKQDIELALQVLEKMKDFGIVFLKIIISLILSYIFIVDRNKLREYLKTVKKSNFGFLYTEYKTIIEKIVKTFGAAFKAQSFIAGINAILTGIGLLFIGWFSMGQTFPFIYTLVLIVFICGFIPFVGLVISSIPMLIIGFTMGDSGATVVIQILVLLIIIHLIEAYYLNPKIVSSLIHLPISLTFVILLVSEHFFGFAGLIIGVGVFYLLIELLKDTDRIISIAKKTFIEMDRVEFDVQKSIKNDIRLGRKVEKN